ncbi:MAG: glycosyltransferase family 4 protein [Prevotella sp.]|nr:glycosyltransferase family 4 protein [Candidatus Prevotella equi]
MKRVMMVGSAEQSAGGVSSVIKLIKKMPVWEEYSCYWLGTQIQRNYLWKLWYAVKSNIIAFFIMWKYSIIHMHTTPDKLGLLIQLPVLLWAKCLRKKVILHLHVGNQLKTKKNPLFVFCLKRADRIVFLAKKWENLFSIYYPEVNIPTAVIYNPVEDVDLFSSERECPQINRKFDVNTFDAFMKQKEKRIMMAAWYNDNKAPDVLLKAIRSLTLTISKREGTEYLDGWKVDMLGNGEVERFKKMAEDMGLSDIVSFPGYVTGKEREEYFRKASIYCMCSYEEGFPMVVLESWMYGINVVTTPVGGLPDVIEEGKNCLTFDFGDDEGLAKQLLVLMDNAEKRREMAEYSLEFAINHFSMEKINEDLKELYSLL